MASSLGVIFCLTVLAIFVQGRVLADSGSLNSCGGSKFKLSWSPAVLKANEKYTIKVSGEASVKFDKGTVHTTIWQKGKNLWNNTQGLTCDEVAEQSPIKLKCPVPKGQKMDITDSYTMPDIFGVIPAGEYVVLADIHNEDDQKFLCLKGSITVADP